MSEQEVYTVREVAAMMGYSRQMVYDFRQCFNTFYPL